MVDVIRDILKDNTELLHRYAETDTTSAEMIRKVSDMLSPVLLPMIDVMGDDMGDIIS